MTAITDVLSITAIKPHFAAQPDVSPGTLPFANIPLATASESETIELFLRTFCWRTMSYSLITIWYERTRFLPAIFAVAFSAILIAVQCGLVIGLLSMMSLPVDKATADVWVGYPGVRSVDLGQPLPERWVSRVADQPEVERTETSVIGFSMWTPVSTFQTPGTPEPVTIVGTRLERDSLGAVECLRDSPDIQAALTSELERKSYLQMSERDFKVPGWMLSTGTLRVLALFVQGLQLLVLPVSLTRRQQAADDG